MIYVNCIFVHYNKEEDKWASKLIWDSLQRDELRKKEGKNRGDFLGVIETQYFESTLQIAVESVVQLAKAFGIADSSPYDNPKIYYTEDEDLLELFPCDENLESYINEENKRRGWL
ncbi:hypothetical protein BSK59_13185 [Paenibacillus odorifer]|uniref:hypothetical protein n=1 Tax=Paenibacillus odorifer TaxID=189426 RepID=UPI0009701292|nr:hypothetical protein [Paenibacillus odorifer]OME55426.1 hypothetical protein BSK59_13185 [Paenibacillus odorifer]